VIDIEKKIIFTHPPKCGGTTIEGAFKWHPNYVCLKTNPDYVNYFKQFKHGNLKKHIEYIESLGYQEKDFFKISCIRNPWDLIRSWSINHKHHKQVEAEGSFEEYVERVFLHKNVLDMKEYFYYNGSYYIDYVIRFENYKQECETIFEKYNVSWPDVNFNTNSRPQNTDYKDIHTEMTKNVVYEKAKFIIDTFGYTF
jgi:hypothetical protein